MEIQVLKLKFHCLTITQVELHYIGSVKVDEGLTNAGMYVVSKEFFFSNLVS